MFYVIPGKVCLLLLLLPLAILLNSGRRSGFYHSGICHMIPCVTDPLRLCSFSDSVVSSYRTEISSFTPYNAQQSSQYIFTPEYGIVSSVPGSGSWPPGSLR